MRHSVDIPDNIHVDIQVNEFETTLTEILDTLEKNGDRLAPTFAFIDPFGFRGAPFSLVKRLLKYDRTEVFINIMVEFINRFVEHPSDTVKQHIKDLLDASDAEIGKVLDAQDRILAFQELYQEKLRNHAKFARFFEMRDSRNKVIYYLFFASNHPLGHVKMKEAFWKLDSERGYKFSDRTDPNQQVLFELDPSGDLAQILKKQFNETTQLAEKVISFVEDETAYISSHARKALSKLENKSEISVDDMKVDGTKRRKGSFPVGVIIHF